MKNRKLGIIGGSGLYKMEGFEKPKWKKIDTPWGSPSDSVMVAKFYGNDICFLPRHSRGHKISPTNINFRANIDAMKQLGVTDLISVSAVGSLKGSLDPGTFVIIDQFIMSAEDKWGAVSDLVLLLPHGFEGQGPEHSSTRLERFLQGCAEDNIVVANLSTPAQYFHALRRQKKKEYAKPLVLMSPKSLLRHKSCVSMLKDLTHGEFQDFLSDPTPAKKTEILVLCSGKVYYDLIEARESIRTPKATIIRIEQFYPFNQSQFLKTIEPALRSTFGRVT